MRAVTLEVETLSPSVAVEKVRRGGVTVLGACRAQKNVLLLTVDGKDRQKVFAILQNTCYNIKKIRPRAWSRLLLWMKEGVGLLAGGAVALSLVAFAESRVLRIEVEGSGAYLSREVESVLSENGVNPFSPLPKDRAALSSRILELPRVCFCSLSERGGVLTVRVEVEDGISPFLQEPLLSPASGTVEQLLVLRGTALVSVGDEVEAGQPVVGDYARYGEDIRPVTVMARVRIRFPVHRVYEGDEAAARAQATLDYGNIEEITFTPTDGGYFAEGTGRADASLHFG